MDDNGYVLKELKVLCEPDKLRGFSPLPLSIVIESWYWAYRMLSERHEVVKPNADKGNSFGQGEDG
ncbi:MAG: hypothetical protein QW606_05965 [Conexivisphaerales archaeon]